MLKNVKKCTFIDFYSYIKGMKLNKKIVALMVLLITAALIGLVYVQILLLDQAFALRQQTFRQNVNGALGSVVEKLETMETLHRVIRVTVGVTGDSTSGLAMLDVTGEDSTGRERSMLWVNSERFQPKVDIDENRLILRLDHEQRVRLICLDADGNEIEEVLDESIKAGIHEIDLKPEDERWAGKCKLTLDGTTYEMTVNPASSKRFGNIVVRPTFAQSRRALVDKVLEQYVYLYRVPITQRIDTLVLDSLVYATLHEKGIRMDCAYGIVSSEKDSVVLAEPDGFQRELLASDLRTQLFPHDIYVEPNDLVFYFPGQKITLLKQQSFSAGITLAFILIIIGCFVFVVGIILKQKRLSGLLVEFINNMTHEFKTPISTISLASEALNQKKVLENKSRVKKYGSIILDESVRMRKQVEKILEMAALEKGDFELQFSTVDIHELIRSAVNNFTLAAEKRNGRIACEFHADQHEMEGDGFHLMNIIHNLFDNAVKYTRRNPKILITTENKNQDIVISVKDNGIGLKPDQQKRIFDKYYRVPTGNVHDVKGFGLGLSYVKLMVKAHGGSIGLTSEAGKGSVFTIILPLRQGITRNEESQS